MIKNQLSKIKCVILAGGLGTRFSEETINKPKPLIEIGSIPIMMHIIKLYNFFGVKNFLICGGYKIEKIKEYFLNFKYIDNDFEINTQKTYGESRFDFELKPLTDDDESDNNMTKTLVIEVKNVVTADYCEGKFHPIKYIYINECVQ